MSGDDPTGLPPDETHFAQVADPNEPHCHRCGAPHDRFQEYCLECGARLTPLPAEFRSVASSPMMFWASLIALLVIALITAAVVIAATDDDEKSGTASSSSLPATVVPTGLTTIPIPPTTLGPVPTLPTTTIPTTLATTTAATTTAQTTTAQTTTAQTTTTGTGLTQWPSGKTGYTIILESVPQSQGRSVAESKAEAAQDKGLAEVGVLNTNNYDLQAGYYAVFSGVKNTKAEADAGVAQARSAGYPNAYVRKIVPK